MPFDAALDRLHDLSKFDFPVQTRAVQVVTPNGPVNVSRYNAIVREDNNEVIAIHSKKYKLTPHADVFRQTIEKIRDQLDLNGAMVEDHVFNKGAEVMREIRLPAYTEKGPDGKPVFFRIRQHNSYDATRAYYMDVGTWREWCKNGAMSILERITGVHMRHTAEIDAAAEGGRLQKALEAFKDESGIWRVWAKSKVEDTNVDRLFRRTLVAQPTHAEPDAINKKQFEKLWDAWLDHRSDLGANAWGLYNAVTWWASHGEGRTRPAEQISIQREGKVRAMVSSRAWKELIAA